MLRGSHGALQRAGQLETGGGRPYLLYSGGYKRLSRYLFSKYDFLNKTFATKT